jgi:pimeloyl-ACP methyl ester carboxylesterase
MLYRFLPALASWFVFSNASLCAQDLFFDSKGVKIHYTIHGKGEPVLLIHGFTVTYSIQWVYPGISSALTRNYQVIGFDCRGHGQSGKPHDPKKYGLEMVEDALRLLDHLNIKKAHVVGYSMGGFIALKLAALHPDRVLSVTTGGAGWEKSIDQRFLEELADALDRGDGIGLLLTRLTPDGRPKPTPEQLRFSRLVLNAFADQKALASVARSLKELAISEPTWKSFKTPTLAIVGALDPLKKGVDNLKGVLPQMEIVVIEGADHMNAFAQPEFVASLKAFLARNSQVPRAAPRHQEIREKAEKCH